MLISHFELLVKRIAPIPPGTANLPLNAPFRRIVQGYFLTISNLDTRAVNLRLRTTIPIGNPVFDREFVTSPPASANVRTGFDVASSNNVNLAFTPTGSVLNAKRFITQSFRIAPNETVSVNLLPNVATTLVAESLEVRGFAELIQQPATFPEFLFGVSSAKLLVSAEYRGTTLDNDYPSSSTSNDLDFDQIAYSMPLALGQSSGVVEAVSGSFVLTDNILIPRVALPKSIQKILDSKAAIALNQQITDLDLEAEESE